MIIIPKTPPRIVLGETFFSWISRALAQDKLRNPHFFKKTIEDLLYDPARHEVGAVEIWPLPAVKDFEFTVDGPLFELASREFGYDLSYLRRFFYASEKLLINISFRNVYCEQCLRDGLAVVGFPVWQKRWCYCTSAYCVEHSLVLLKSSDRRSPESRIWSCYLDSSEFERELVSLPERYRAVVTIRVQRWIQRLLLKSDAFSNAVCYLYKIFLSARTVYSPSGCAAAMYDGERKVICRMNLSILERLELGINQSSPKQRRWALLLVGRIVGLVSEDEFLKIIGKDHYLRWAAPSSLELLGRLSVNALNKEEAEFILRILKALKSTGKDCTRLFLRGVEGASNAIGSGRHSFAKKTPE